jgi:hypothetical protein
MRLLKVHSICRWPISWWLMGVLAAGAVLAGEPPNWSVERGTDPYSEQTACLLVSRHLQMPDGYGTANVRLVFGPTALVVTTDSNIDASYPDQGLTVDDNPSIRPDSPFPLKRQNVLFMQAQAELIQQFRRGYHADLTLGFWPTWPVTETQHLRIDLKGFSSAHDSYRACRGETAAAQ